MRFIRFMIAFCRIVLGWLNKHSPIITIVVGCLLIAGFGTVMTMLLPIYEAWDRSQEDKATIVFVLWLGASPFIIQFGLQVFSAIEQAWDESDT